MKKLILFLVLISSTTYAKSIELSGFGLGAMIGDPTAISFKGYLGNNHYVDGALGYNTGYADALYLHGDYLIEKPDFFKIKSEYFNLYYGIGGRGYWEDTKKHKNEFHLGVRAPVGVSYYFKDPSLELFGEISGIMEFVPDTTADIDLSLGVRYWF